MAPAIADFVVPNRTQGVIRFITITNMVKGTQMVGIHYITTICIVRYFYIVLIIDFIAHHERCSVAIAMLRNAHAMTIFIGTDDIFLVPYTPVPIVFATFIGNRVLL